MSSYQEALSLLRESAQPQHRQSVNIQASLGKIVAQDVYSPIAIPPFDNSAMDGFALHLGKNHPPQISISGRIAIKHSLAAGETLDQADQSTAVEIMTGAPMPAGFDTVIPVEKVQVRNDAQGQWIEIAPHTVIQHGDHVRYRGEDIQPRQKLISRGTRIHPGHIAAFMATGITSLECFTMPSIDIISTGKEIQTDYEKPLKSGEIYDSNTPYLLAQMHNAGLPARHKASIADDEDAFAQQLRHTSGARIIISSGAVSKGKWDFIPQILTNQGAKIIFHGCQIKPGKPILFAILDDGRYYFGLPGNPVSVAAGLRFFVMPLIREILSMPAETEQKVIIKHDYEKKGPLRHFLKAKIEYEQQGSYVLQILDGQESFKIAPMLEMNCWAILDENMRHIQTGDAISVASSDLFPSL